MKTFRLSIILGVAAALVAPAFAQTGISVASGYRVEFVANPVYGFSINPATTESGDLLTGFTLSPSGDIFATKTVTGADFTRLYRIAVSYAVGSSGLQNVVFEKLERLVTDFNLSGAVGGPFDIQGVAVDSEGTAYMLDRLDGRIFAAEPDSTGDGFSDNIRLFADFAVLSSPSNLAFQLNNGLTTDLYVTDRLASGQRVIYTIQADRNGDGMSDGWSQFAAFNVNLDTPPTPMGFALELVGSGPSTRHLFVAHETVGLYKVLADANGDGTTDGIQQLSTVFKGSLAFQTTAAGGGGTDLFVVRSLSDGNSNTITRLTFRTNGQIDTFTDLASGFQGPVALATGKRGDLFVAERRTGNIYRISQAAQQTVSVIITPGIGLLYTLPQLANYANSLLPGVAQVFSGTYEDFVFAASVIISQNDRLVLLPGQRMVFPGGRRLEIRGGMEGEGTNLNGFDLATGEFESVGNDVSFVSLAGFQQETGRLGIAFGKPAGVSKSGVAARFSAKDAAGALAGVEPKVGVTFAYATLSSADLAGGWDGILFNQHNQLSRLARFSVRYANRGITYQELTPNVQIRDDNLILEDGLIDSNHTGVYLNNTNPMIRRCVIQRNHILVVAAPGGGNTAAPESGTGLYCTNTALPLVVQNYLRRNAFNGVAMLNNARPRLGNPADSFVFRNTGQGNVGQNVFLDNGFNAVFCNTARLVIPRQYAQNNYWGTTDPAEIEALIFHYADNSSFSEVVFDQRLPETPEIPLPIADPPITGPTAVGEAHWSLYR